MARNVFIASLAFFIPLHRLRRRYRRLRGSRKEIALPFAHYPNAHCAYRLLSDVHNDLLTREHTFSFRSRHDGKDGEWRQVGVRPFLMEFRLRRRRFHMLLLLASVDKVFPGAAEPYRAEDFCTEFDLVSLKKAFLEKGKNGLHAGRGTQSPDFHEWLADLLHETAGKSYRYRRPVYSIADVHIEIGFPSQKTFLQLAPKYGISSTELCPGYEYNNNAKRKTKNSAMDKKSPSIPMNQASGTFIHIIRLGEDLYDILPHTNMKKWAGHFQLHSLWRTETKDLEILPNIPTDEWNKTALFFTLNTKDDLTILHTFCQNLIQHGTAPIGAVGSIPSMQVTSQSHMPLGDFASACQPLYIHIGHKCIKQVLTHKLEELIDSIVQKNI